MKVGAEGKCEVCEGAHPVAGCPKVESVEFFESGAVRRVVLRDFARQLPPYRPVQPNVWPYWGGTHIVSSAMKPNQVGVLNFQASGANGAAGAPLLPAIQ